MPIAAVGPYQIEREIGRGGMGVVYLARDTRLDRQAALKALPEHVASDPERLQRFEREAKVLASLSHPNIAGIYGVEQAGGRSYLALEYVEGRTLADRLTSGPLPIEETVELCLQIASGIEAAHENGVIHRDLKPSNVVITPDDQVKVVDFGLAKGKVADTVGPVGSPAQPDSPVHPSSPTLTQSPTHPPAGTVPGVILGTAPYLSPEQARGKVVDRRTDIWSFGCILYECLTGTRAFQGETVSDTIAQILRGDLDWSRLPRQTPHEIRGLLMQCLIKDPKHRLRDIGDARLVLEQLKTGGPAPVLARSSEGTRGLRNFGRPAGIGILVGALFASALWIVIGPGTRRTARPLVHLSIVVPDDIRVMRERLTPDGSSVVICGAPRAQPGAKSSLSQLYLRRLDRDGFEPIRGGENAWSDFDVSPDSRWVSFASQISENAAERHGVKVALDGSGPPVHIVDIDKAWSGGPGWLESGDILMPTNDGREYVRILKNGSTSTASKFEARDFDGSFRFGPTLPRDRGVLCVRYSYEKGAFQTAIGVLDLKTRKTRILVRDAGNPRYSPTGHLLYTRGDALFASAFDLDRLEVRGDPVGMLAGLRATTWGPATFDYAKNGTLLYAPGGMVSRTRRPVVVDSRGSVSEWSPARQPFESPIAVSPDGSRLAAVIPNAKGIYEIWMFERGRPSGRRVVSVPGADCSRPIWSRDGLRIAFAHVARSDTDGVYVGLAYGTATPRRVATVPKGSAAVPVSWSSDASQILVTVARDQASSLGMIRLNGAENHEDKIVTLAVQSYGDDAKLSPDGKLLAYSTTETGTNEVYIHPFGPDGLVGEPVPISSGGGYDPRWAPDGKRLWFLRGTSPRQVMSVAITRVPSLRASVPQVQWDIGEAKVVPGLLDILPDGRFIAIQKGEGEDQIKRFDVILNFDEELRARFARRH